MKIENMFILFYNNVITMKTKKLYNYNEKIKIDMQKKKYVDT